MTSIQSLNSNNIYNKENINPFISDNKRRKIVPFSTNLTPSINESLTEDLIIHHAFMRIQLFVVTAFALYGIAMRSSGVSVDIDFSVARATIQAGQGHNGNHASHSHTAGSLVDNRKSTFLKEIESENKITPNKLLFLSNKLNKEALKIISTMTPKDQAEYLKSVLPDNLLDKSNIENTINSTVVLPRKVNLIVDKNLENYLRPSILPGLYKMLSAKRITPEEATIAYVQSIREHFQKRLEVITDPKIYLYTDLELEGTQVPDFSLLAKQDRTEEESQELSLSLLRHKLNFQ